MDKATRFLTNSGHVQIVRDLLKGNEDLEEVKEEHKTIEISSDV